MLGIEIRDVNKPVMATVATPQVRTDPALSGFRFGVIAVVQDHQLHIAEDRFDRVVVWTAFGQADPMQVKFPHRPPRLARFAGMGPVLIEHHPKRGLGIPAAHLSHELANAVGAFAG